MPSTSFIKTEKLRRTHVMRLEKTLVMKLDEKFKRKLDAMSTRTGTFDTREFKLFSKILDRSDHLRDSKAVPHEFHKIRYLEKCI